MSDEIKKNGEAGQQDENKKAEPKKKKEYKQEHEVFPGEVRGFHYNNRKVGGRPPHKKASEIPHLNMPRAVSTEDPEPATRNVALFFAFRDRTEENKGGSGNENKIGKETEEEDNPEYYPLSEYYPGVMHDWFEYPMVFYNVLDTKSVMWFLLNDVKETLGTEVTYVTDFDVSSDTLPPDDPDWLKGFTLDEQIIEGTEEDTGYSNLEYDPDGKLISGDWLGIDPAYMIGKYDDPNESQIFHGWHGKGYPDKRFDEMLIGDVPIVEDLVIDENGSTVSAAVITIPVEKDGFHFVVQPVEENGKIVYKLVFVPRLNQKGYDMKF